MISIGISITIFLISMSFLFHKYKIMFVLDSIWVFILMVFNNGGGDYEQYYFIYEAYKNSPPRIFSSDYIYGNLCHISQKIGIDFVTFNSITTAVALIVLIVIVHKITTKPGIIMSLFMLLPMADFIQQKRNFLSSVVILYAIYIFSRSDKNKIDKLKYLILCCIAGGIHSIGYVYIFFIFIDNIKKITLNYKSVILFVVSTALVPFYPYIASLLFQSSKVNLYFYDLNNRLSILKVIIFVLIQVVFFILHCLIYKNINTKFKNETLIKLDYLMLFLSPLYYYNSTFFRIYKNIIIFQYSDYSNMFTNNGRYSKSALQLIIIYFIFIILIFMFSYVLTGNIGADVLIGGIFNYNSFFDLF